MSTPAQRCAVCLKRNFGFSNIHIPFRYQFPISKLCLALKFQENLMAGQVLGELIHNSFENLPKIDIIIPTPLHQQRLKERGFNQSVIIAKAISKFTNIPIDTNILIRHKATLAQSGLTASARKKILKMHLTLSAIFVIYQLW